MVRKIARMYEFAAPSVAAQLFVALLRSLPQQHALLLQLSHLSYRRSIAICDRVAAVPAAVSAVAMAGTSRCSLKCAALSRKGIPLVLQLLHIGACSMCAW
jgi:hypothetical protein